jgi:hypothetical protein
MRSILRRLSSSDRTHAVVIAIGHGWIAVPIEPDGLEGVLVPQVRPVHSGA